jgi:prepilin-type processing-associated H-X9-DG protein
MTFQRPLSGTFQYKGNIPSSAMNIIDAAIPNALDKTGDNVASSGGISGEIDILSAGSIQFLSGSLLVLATGSHVNGGIDFISTNSAVGMKQDAPTTDAAVGNMVILAANAYSSASTNTSGGNITIQTGSHVGSGSRGILTLSIGQSSDAINVFTASDTGTTIFGGNSNSAISIYGAHISISNPLVEFDSTQSTPKITQQSVSSGDAQPLTIVSQGATSGFGGDLFLSAGYGSSGNGKVYVRTNNDINPLITASDTSVDVYPVGTTRAMTFLPFVGLGTGQAAINTVIPFYYETIGGLGTVTAYTIHIPDTTAMMVEVVWIRRDVLAITNTFGGRAANVCYCDGSGTVSTGSQGWAYNGGAFDSSTHVFASSLFDSDATHGVQIVASGANSININLYGTATSQLWQGVIYITEM